MTTNTTHVRWVSISGSFSLHMFGNTTPVVGGNESDGTTLYIARAEFGGGTHNGKVRVGEFAHIPYGGKELLLSTYQVLVYTTPDHWKSNRLVGSYKTPDRDWRHAIKGEKNSEVVSISRVATPQVAIGLTMVDISNNCPVRITTYADKISSNQFTIHIDTWADTTLYYAAASWLALAADDPYFQTGVFDSQDVRPSHKPGNVVRRVNFPRTFESQPKVTVGISGFDIGNNWRIRVYATDIDTKGFTIHAITWGDSKLYSAKATWIAFPSNKDGVWSESFSSEGSGDFNGQADFGVTFSKTPLVFAALTEFDTNDKNLRVNVEIDGVTTSSLTWRISKWGDTVLYMVGGMYVALER